MTCSAEAEGLTKVRVPYGGETLEAEVPERSLMGVVGPQRFKGRDEERALAEALEHPLGPETIRDFAAGKGGLLVVVNDGTRPTPTPRVLEAMRMWLREGRFIVATGAHRAPTPEEYRLILGRFYEGLRERVYVHDSEREDEMEFVGRTREGTDIYLNRMLLESERVLVIGSVEPHYFAGYTGGRKMLIPGLAGYRTIEQNHRLSLRRGAEALRLEGNPVHEDLMEGVAMIRDKRIFSVMMVLDYDHRIYEASSGSLEESFRAATRHASDIFTAAIPEKADVVVSVVQYPMDVDLYQSQKALDNGRLAVKDGGILILVSRCREGIGARAFLDLLASAQTPGEALAKLQEGYRLGYHKSAKIAEIAQRAQIWALTGLEPSIVKKAFIQPLRSLDEGLSQALKEKGRDAKVLFLMDGCNTVPRTA